MKKIVFASFAMILLCSHDMFLKLDDYFLKPNTESIIQLFNGTFKESENVIDRNRMVDASMVINGDRVAIDSTQWSERDLTTFLNFKTGKPGTYVLGVSTAARTIEMEAGRFNDYLEHDGVVDMLLSRKQKNLLEQDANEKYSKHVKTIFQVGDEVSQDWNTNLGYPIEFIPMENPYAIHTGHSLEIQLLKQGKPLADQLVLIGIEASDTPESEAHSHGDGEMHTHEADEAETGHSHTGQQEVRTNAEGILKIELKNEGIYHLRTIYMEEINIDDLTHESNWATLTFAIGAGNGHSHSHGDASHTHDNDDHDHEDEGFPSYIFWLISGVILIGLFLYFNRRK
jgi:hypothetical protein